MPRKQRIEFSGAIFHVWARRVDRWPLFVDDEDYERYLFLLERTVERFCLVLREFCLMPNHVHLLVELTEPNLDKAMHDLHGKYVRRFNRRHGRAGRLFEDRFRWKPVVDELYLHTVAQYIRANPVKAALCKRPEEWPWSSRGVIAQRGRPDWLAGL